MYGAVDLSSLSAPPAGGGEAASKVRGGVVVDVTAQSMASALDVSVRAQVLSLLLACGASLFLALCGWVAERWCVVEGDDDDENLDGYQASGAST